MKLQWARSAWAKFESAAAKATKNSYACGNERPCPPYCRGTRRRVKPAALSCSTEEVSVVPAASRWGAVAAISSNTGVSWSQSCWMVSSSAACAVNGTNVCDIQTPEMIVASAKSDHARRQYVLRTVGLSRIITWSTPLRAEGCWLTSQGYIDQRS